MVVAVILVVYMNEIGNAFFQVRCHAHVLPFLNVGISAQLCIASIHQRSSDPISIIQVLDNYSVLSSRLGYEFEIVIIQNKVICPIVVLADFQTLCFAHQSTFRICSGQDMEADLPRTSVRVFDNDVVPAVRLQRFRVCLKQASIGFYNIFVVTDCTGVFFICSTQIYADRL